jgi:hypothetical protein
MEMMAGRRIFLARTSIMRWQPKVGLEDDPSSLADYEYIIFGVAEPW